ncbi:Archaeal ATPase [methanogenic archaeon ISO4-H5]|nr:Archaeal ATPase [methanogenic archaeon ISO4-H5]
MEFIGRESELGLLGRIFAEERVKTCMVYGRRRIGKTSTILKFIEGRRSLYIDLVRGPEVRNVRRIADKLEEAFGIKPDVRDLRSVLESVKGVCSQGKTIIIFDELPYLIHNNPYAASELQHFVDWIRNSTDSMVIVCGSSVKMMSDGMLKKDSPLYGRFAFKIDMSPMSITEARKFHPSISDTDMLKLYLTLDGITAYHDMVGDNDYRTVINRYVLDRNGLIGDEIVYDLQTELGASSSNAMAVLDAISAGNESFGEIANYTGLSDSSVNESIKDLVSMRVISKMEHLPTPTKSSRYVISDLAISFWSSIADRYRSVSLMKADEPYDAMSQLISTHLGKAFELYCIDLISSNYPCTAVGQWWGPVPQRDAEGRLMKGPEGKVITEYADIDVVATIRQGNARIDLFGECKFTGPPMGFGALNLLVSRVRSLKGGYNVRYALFSASGFTDELREYAEENGILLFGQRELLYKDEMPALR